MKKEAILIPIIALIFIAGCATEKPIGGDKDEYGCLVAAGYTWCESKQKCIRTWEEGCPSEEEFTCETDNDCIPLPSDCHPMFCINKGYESAYKKPDACTEIFMLEAAYNPEDCVCIEKRCTNKNKGKTPDDVDQETKLSGIVEDYIKNLDNYKEYNGRDIEIIKVMQAKCPGCWVVDAIFYLDSIKNLSITDEVEIQITLNNWEVTETSYVEGKPESDQMTLNEAKLIAEESECTEKGTLTNNSFYNNYTKTWWIDIDMKEEFKKDFCNPACVISEETKTAVINWRCTGALP